MIRPRVLVHRWSDAFTASGSLTSSSSRSAASSSIFSLNCFELTTVLVGLPVELAVSASPEDLAEGGVDGGVSSTPGDEFPESVSLSSAFTVLTSPRSSVCVPNSLVSFIPVDARLMGLRPVGFFCAFRSLRSVDIGVS